MCALFGGGGCIVCSKGERRSEERERGKREEGRRGVGDEREYTPVNSNSTGKTS